MQTDTTFLTDAELIELAPRLKAIYPELEFVLMDSPNNPGLGIFSPTGLIVEGSESTRRDGYELVLYIFTDERVEELVIVPVDDPERFIKIITAVAVENTDIQVAKWRQADLKPQPPRGWPDWLIKHSGN